MRALRGGKRRQQGRLTPGCRRSRGSWKWSGRRRRRVADRGDDKLGDGAVVLLGAVPGSEEEAGGGAVRFLVSLGLDDERSDGGEEIKSRPWRCHQKILEKGKNFREENRGDLGEEKKRRRRSGGGGTTRVRGAASDARLVVGKARQGAPSGSGGGCRAVLSFRRGGTGEDVTGKMGSSGPWRWAAWAAWPWVVGGL